MWAIQWWWPNHLCDDRVCSIFFSVQRACVCDKLRHRTKSNTISLFNSASRWPFPSLALVHFFDTSSLHWSDRSFPSFLFPRLWLTRSSFFSFVVLFWCDALLFSSIAILSIHNYIYVCACYQWLGWMVDSYSRFFSCIEIAKKRKVPANIDVVFSCGQRSTSGISLTFCC